MIGVYDHPHDPDVPFLRSHSVGSSWPTDAARKLTEATKQAEKFLDGLVPIL